MTLRLRSVGRSDLRFSPVFLDHTLWLSPETLSVVVPHHPLAHSFAATSPAIYAHFPLPFPFPLQSRPRPRLTNPPSRLVPCNTVPRPTCNLFRRHPPSPLPRPLPRNQHALDLEDLAVPVSYMLALALRFAPATSPVIAALCLLPSFCLSNAFHPPSLPTAISTPPSSTSTLSPARLAQYATRSDPLVIPLHTRRASYIPHLPHT